MSGVKKIKLKNNNQGGVTAPHNNKEKTMPKLNKLFKKIQKFDVIENNKVKHLFKITHLDNSTAVYDNDGNLVMKSTINKANNNKGETMPNVEQGFEYKNYSIKPADNFNKDFLVYKLINGNARFVKGFSSIEKAKTFIDESNNKEKK